MVDCKPCGMLACFKAESKAVFARLLLPAWKQLPPPMRLCIGLVQFGIGEQHEGITPVCLLAHRIG